MLLAFSALLFIFLDSIFNLCLKDVSKAVTSELTCRLRTDPFALQRFYQSFGLDPVKLLPESLEEFFPDTPIKLLRDVFDELQLYDLVELLEKVKPRTLRPVFPLKEIRKALNATNRPTKFYSKAEVLIIKFSESVAADYNVLSFRSFLKALNPESNITTVTSGNLAERLGTLKETKKMVEDEDRRASTKETKLKELLDKRVPFSWYKHKSPELTLSVGRNSNEQLLKVFYKEEQEMRKELENVTKQREQWTKEIKPKIEKEIKQKEEELQGENEKFQMAVCDVMDKWICQASDEGLFSRCFLEVTPRMVLCCFPGRTCARNSLVLLVTIAPILPLYTISLGPLYHKILRPPLTITFRLKDALLL